MEARLRSVAGGKGPLLRANEGRGVAAVFERVLGAIPAFHRRESATVAEQLRQELDTRD